MPQPACISFTSLAMTNGIDAFQNHFHRDQKRRQHGRLLYSRMLRARVTIICDIPPLLQSTQVAAGALCTRRAKSAHLLKPSGPAPAIPSRFADMRAAVSRNSASCRAGFQARGSGAAPLWRRHSADPGIQIRRLFRGDQAFQPRVAGHALPQDQAVLFHQLQNAGGRWSGSCRTRFSTSRWNTGPSAHLTRM